MNLQEAFEKAKIEYEDMHASREGRLKVEQPEDLKNIDNDSVTDMSIGHEFSGKLPRFKDYPNLEEIDVSSNYKMPDLSDQDLSQIKSLSVSPDYSESRITFNADSLIELYLNVQNNTYSEQISLFGNERPVIDLHNLNNLKKLRLSHVKGCEIIWPENPESVKQLMIEDGEFTDYDFLDSFSNVENLRLSSCNILDCSFINKMTHLSVLDLSRNNIKTMDKPASHLSFLDLRRNGIEDEAVYSFADEVLISERDELIHRFKDNICHWFLYVSYSSVVRYRTPDPKRPGWQQKMIATNTDEELFTHMLSVNVSRHIAGVLDPDSYQNRRATLTFEEMKEVALEIFPFITITQYQIEKKGKHKNYIKVEESKN